MFASRGALAVSVADFGVYSLTNAAGQVVLPGRLYVPPEAVANPNVPRPFITFLHGGALSGTDNLLQLTGVNDNLLAEAKQHGAYLYVPQTPTNWGSLSVIDNVMAMIDRAIAEQNVDGDRLYVTGHSNGGGGTWNLLSRYPNRFAAAIPISAVAPASGFAATNLIETPIWAFHARDDSTVSVNTTRTVVNSVLAAAGSPVPSYRTGSSVDYFVSNPQLPFHQFLSDQAHQQRNVFDFFITGANLDFLYYESAFGGYNILGIYNSPEIYDWMFSHTRAVPEPSVCGMVISLVALVFCRAIRVRRSVL